MLLLLLLLSRFSRVRLCATPETAAHQAPPSLGFSRQEHWSGLPFPSPMPESEKWKGSHSVVSDSLRPHGLQPTRLLHPWDFPGKSTGVRCFLSCFQFSSATPLIGVFIASSMWMLFSLFFFSFLFFFLRHSGRREGILGNCGMKERSLALELKDKSEVQICYFLMGNFEQAISDPWIQ